MSKEKRTYYLFNIPKEYMNDEIKLRQRDAVKSFVKMKSAFYNKDPNKQEFIDEFEKNMNTYTKTIISAFKKE